MATRKEVYKESTLPPSFCEKMRKEFIGLKCPICGRTMGITTHEDGLYLKTPSPSIQHNIPISKGGKHELSNISVICMKCNSSIQSKPTGDLNNALVQVIWRWKYGRQG